MNSIWHFIGRLQDSVLQPNTIKLFKRLLYLMALLNFLYLIPIADEVWGMDYYIILRDQYESRMGHFSMLLNHEFWRDRFWWFLGPELVLLFIGVIGKDNLILRIITWFLFVNLHYANPEVSNGGWHAMHHLMLFSIFMVNKASSGDRRSALGNLFTNLGFYACWVQVCIIYLVAGLHKLLGTHWLAGDAIFIILSTPEYSLPFIFENLKHNNLLLRLVTWMTLTYQILFSLIIWIKNIRPYYLIFGLVMHLAIVFIVGVSEFGLILIVSYSVFLSDTAAIRALQWLDLRRVFSKRAGSISINGIGD